MAISELERFNEFADSIGNRYAAIQIVSNWARELSKDYRDYHLLESKLLQWVITGKCPYVESQLESRKVRANDDGIDEILCWVLDEDVVDEVKNLYRESIRNRKLTYCKRTDLGPGRVSRINILLRMIWFSYTE